MEWPIQSVTKTDGKNDFPKIYVIDSVITAKFPDAHRVFTSEDNAVHYLAILNADSPDMFVLLQVDEHSDTTVRMFDIITNYRRHAGVVVRASFF